MLCARAGPRPACSTYKIHKQQSLPSATRILRTVIAPSSNDDVVHPSWYWCFEGIVHTGDKVRAIPIRDPVKVFLEPSLASKYAEFTHQYPMFHLGPTRKTWVEAVAPHSGTSVTSLRYIQWKQSMWSCSLTSWATLRFSFR